MPLEPGDKAPDFTLVDQTGEPFKLSKSIKDRKAPHLIYFYPKADTPGCTTQACGVRDHAADYDAANAVVLGVSPDYATIRNLELLAGGWPVDVNRNQ